MYKLLHSPHGNENEQAIFIGFNWAWSNIINKILHPEKDAIIAQYQVKVS
jgi:hypothetical protein